MRRPCSKKRGSVMATDTEQRVEQIDPVTLSVINNAFVNVCREMGTAMMRTSYSPIFNEVLALEEPESITRTAGLVAAPLKSKEPIEPVPAEAVWFTNRRIPPLMVTAPLVSALPVPAVRAAPLKVPWLITIAAERLLALVKRI